jgi:hypothetical protein
MADNAALLFAADTEWMALGQCSETTKASWLPPVYRALPGRKVFSRHARRDKRADLPASCDGCRPHVRVGSTAPF